MATAHILVVYTIMMLQIVQPRAQSECYDAYSCVFDDILDINTSIECYGYHSCNQASIQTSFVVYCYGGYSCLNANVVYSKYGRIDCHGLGSCARIDSLVDIDGITYCGGELSCYQSNIFSSYLHCQGERSCADATAHISSSMYAYAYASAQNCTFYSASSNSAYHFYGAYSGDNATIVCGSADTCYVHCYNNACNNLKLLCNGTCNFIVSCSDDAVQSDTCPNGKIIPQDNRLPKLNLLSFDNIYKNSVTRPCYTPITNAIHLDDYEEYENSASLDTTNITGITGNAPICCTSYLSCYDVDIITSMISSNSSVINDIAIRCDGSESCKYSNYIQAVNGGDIHMSGHQAAYSVGIIETTPYYDIFCTALGSCCNSTLKDANNTYCSGYIACQYAVITNISNVWMYGCYSGYHSVMGLKNTLHCGGHYSCGNTIIWSNADMIQIIAFGLRALYSTFATAAEIISCVGFQCMYKAVIQDSGMINCNGTECLYFATIKNGSKIICHGSHCLYNATIENNAIVICKGDKCLYDASIRNVSSIVVNGDNGLSGSTIVSESNEETMIFINGTNDDIFNVYCNSTDECFIDCQSSNACSKLFLHCFGHCYLKCDQSIGVNCPIYGVYDLWTIEAPTISPIDNLSKNPSNNPSYNPSSNPSVYPTMIPTDIPKIMSTGISPTQIPSEPDSPSKSNVDYPTLDVSISSSASPTLRAIKSTISETMKTTTANTMTRSTRTANRSAPHGVTTNEIYLALIICGAAICLGMMALIAYCLKIQQTSKTKNEIEFERVPTNTNVHNDGFPSGAECEETNDLLSSNVNQLQDCDDNSTRNLTNNIPNTQDAQRQEGLAIKDDDDRKVNWPHPQQQVQPTQN